MPGNCIRIVKNWEWHLTIIWWWWVILTKFITKKYVDPPLHLLYTKQGICCMCIKVEHFYTLYKEHSFKQKALLSCQTWWQEENFTSLWFALPLLFQLEASLRHTYANINPILIYSACTPDKENVPCYTVIMTQLFS